jgi:hypothetical protein
MATPDEIDDSEESDGTSESEPLAPRPKKKGRQAGEPKNRGPGKTPTPPTWSNMQPVTVAAQLRRIVDARGDEWTQDRIGALAGLDRSQISRILKGGPGSDDHGTVRVANALDCELRVVPRGSPESVLARLDAADERELRLLADMLDLLLEFRARPSVLRSLENAVKNARAMAADFGTTSVKDGDHSVPEHLRHGR